MNFLITLLIISLIVIVHEFGHFIAARRCGVFVEEFAIGMGPVLFKKQGTETLFSIRAFPIGGFCKMRGEDGEPADVSAQINEKTAEDTPQTPNTDNKTFYNKPIRKRAVILAAGSLMNLFLAFVILFGINLYRGIPVAEVTELIEGYPAERAGILPGDKIIKVNDFPIRIYDDFTFALSEMTNQQPFDITVKRGDDVLTLKGDLQLDEEDERYLFGVYTASRAGLSKEGEKISLWEAIHAAFFKIIFWIKATFILLGRLITTGTFNAGALTGLVGLTSMVGTVYEQTVTISIAATVLIMAELCALISVNIGMLNLFPLPALDGGRLIFVFIEALTRRRVPPEKEAVVHFVGFVLFIALAIVIAVNDVRTFYLPTGVWTF